MSIKKRNIKRLWSKLEAGKDIIVNPPRESGDTLTEIYYKNKLILTSKCSHGGGDAPMELLMKDFKLDKQNLLNFVNCPLSADGWIDKLKKKGYI